MKGTCDWHASIDVVSENVTYLVVIMQTKNSAHIQNRKRKGISVCTRIALMLQLTSMSLLSLERLQCIAILPSCVYCLALYDTHTYEGI